MDKLDLAIYRNLVGGQKDLAGAWNVRKSASALARELHVDEMTVRTRLRRMRESGFLETRVVVDSSVLSETDYHIRFDVHPPASKDEVIRKLKLVDGVYLIRSYFGNILAVELLCDDEETFKRRRELIGRIANSEEMPHYVTRRPKSEFRMDESMSGLSSPSTAIR